LPGLSFNYSNIQGGTTYYWKVVAKNIAGEITASNSPRHFTTLNVPTAPSDITSMSITETSLQITWTDNATNELGYRIYRSLLFGGPYSQVDGDLPPNTTTFNDTGLAVNSKYYYRIIPFNNVGEGSYAQIALTTLAVVPSTPSVTVLNHNSLTVVVNPSVNPSATQFAIMGSVNDTNFYVQQNGSLQSEIFWQTYTEWGGAVGINVIDLQSCQVYSFRVKARNGEDIETQFSDTSMAQLSCNVMTYQASIGWNLLSVPIGGTDTRKSTLFPTSTSDAFAYVGAYTARVTLSSGCGYWLKFNTPDAVNLVGDLVSVDTIDLNPGWNLIGSVSSPVSVSSIVSEPAGIIVSGYYRYEGVYMLSDSIHPMRGYWVKAQSEGKLILNAASNFSKIVPLVPFEKQFEISSSFTFEDQGGHKQTLYLTDNEQIDLTKSELPSVPPVGSFDVRFTTNRYVGYRSLTKDTQEFPIILQNDRSPIKFS
ncbi:MAG: fibronectin type III domain-containing protein, partial [Ignavibacteriales bacterium]|nr:fibronectin type III domain-containing protein [Ignavibacteriales bacterium]